MAPESISPSTSYSQQQYPSPETATTSAAQQQYWSDQAMDTSADYTQQHSHYGMHQYHPQQRYTPEGAMRGIAADDQSLQQTWQSYMYNVSLVFCFLRMAFCLPLNALGWLSTAPPRRLEEENFAAFHFLICIPNASRASHLLPCSASAISIASIRWVSRVMFGYHLCCHLAMLVSRFNNNTKYQ